MDASLKDHINTTYKLLSILNHIINQNDYDVIKNILEKNNILEKILIHTKDGILLYYNLVKLREKINEILHLLDFRLQWIGLIISLIRIKYYKIDFLLLIYLEN